MCAPAPSPGLGCVVCVAVYACILYSLNAASARPSMHALLKLPPTITLESTTCACMCQSACMHSPHLASGTASVTDDAPILTVHSALHSEWDTPTASSLPTAYTSFTTGAHVACMLYAMGITLADAGAMSAFYLESDPAPYQSAKQASFRPVSMQHTKALDNMLCCITITLHRSNPSLSTRCRCRPQTSVWRLHAHVAVLTACLQCKGRVHLATSRPSWCVCDVMLCDCPRQHAQVPPFHVRGMRPR